MTDTHMHEMLALQGEIKVELLKRGVSQSIAHDAAGEIMHLFLSSPVARLEHKSLYAPAKTPIATETPWQPMMGNDGAASRQSDGWLEIQQQTQFVRLPDKP